MGDTGGDTGMNWDILGGIGGPMGDTGGDAGMNWDILGGTGRVIFGSRWVDLGVLLFGFWVLLG